MIPRPRRRLSGCSAVAMVTADGGGAPIMSGWVKPGHREEGGREGSQTGESGGGKGETESRPVQSVDPVHRRL